MTFKTFEDLARMHNGYTQSVKGNQIGISFATRRLRYYINGVEVSCDSAQSALAA